LIRVRPKFDLDADPRTIASALAEYPSLRPLAERAERWRPWRAYAVLHLWRAAV
jgi:3-methyladenine DNA glycosylase/8-oxoguanine DNA glycosylase